MGRFLLGVGILTLFLAAGLWINHHIGTICQPLSQDLQAAATQDLDAGKTLTQKAHSRWQQHRRLLAVFFDHAPMERIDEGFSQLALCKNPDDFTATCAGLSRQLAALDSTHRPSLENIL